MIDEQKQDRAQRNARRRDNEASWRLGMHADAGSEQAWRHIRRVQQV